MDKGFIPSFGVIGFLDATHQGVQFSNSEDPVLYLKDPDKMSRDERRKMLDQIASMNDLSYKEFNDPEITAKIQQYEMAFRMQTAVPEMTDVSKEPDSIIKLYGPDCLCPEPMPPIAFSTENFPKAVSDSFSFTIKDGISMGIFQTKWHSKLKMWDQALRP